MTKNIPLLRTAIAAAAGTAFIGSGLLMALPALADTTGYDTGYQYVQGLAIGAGGQLMQGTDQSTAPVAQSQVEATPVATADGTALTQTTQPVAVSAPAPVAAAAPAVAAAGLTFADIAMPAAWIALLALLILVSLAAWAFSGSERRERYHQPA